MSTYGILSGVGHSFAGQKIWVQNQNSKAVDQYLYVKQGNYGILLCWGQVHRGF